MKTRSKSRDTQGEEKAAGEEDAFSAAFADVSVREDAWIQMSPGSQRRFRQEVHDTSREEMMDCKR